ncbi:lysylphosphatidylglycerol synthase domain-containing protein [Mycoplasma sp. CSL7475-4]|uniref:lysylphosphatidylglycerol synthase domain-containing protein n=1 Tax=Mycoplasma sp. CSL7475-4 TaxID=2973942 RepID=UPI00216B60EC|nr:lysylphosphatidylglycerol synthase domain-containing protein [Mycoplasma sp. CSL7475-4]MCS4536588.1 lysylphosphatidylglycerol synthase domain-containing protein [Mycoplasma sp. CSL7475-4]
MKTIIEKWSRYQSPDVFLNKRLKKPMFILNKKHKNSFVRPLLFSTNKITARVGIATDLFNDFTVYTLAQSISSLIKSKHFTNNKVLLIRDNSLRSHIYLNIFAKALILNGFNIFTIDKNEFIPNSFDHYIAQKTDSIFYVNISEISSKNSLMQVEFNWTGNKVTHDDILYLKEFLQQVDYESVSIPTQNPIVTKVSILDKIIDISKQKIEKNSNFDNLKIGVHLFNSFHYQYARNIYDQLNIDYKISKTLNSKTTDIKLSNLSSINTKNFLHKNDLNLAINKTGKSLVVSIKQKKVYKYLKNEHLAAIYLHFLLNDCSQFDKNRLSKYVIARSIESSSLIDVIARKNKIDFIEYKDEQELFDYLKNNNKELLLAHNHNNEFLFGNSSANKDAIAFSTKIINMTAFYKSCNKTLYDVLMSVYECYGYTNSVVKEFRLSNKNAKLFIERVKNTENFGDMKVVNTKIYSQDIEYSSTLLKTKLNDGSSLIFKYDPLEEKGLILVNTHERKNVENSRLDVVVRQKELLNNVLDLKETEVDKTTRIKSIIKYLLLTAIFIGIFVFLFHTVYNFKTQGVVTDNPLGVIASMWTHIKTNIYSRISFLAIIATFLLTSVVNAIIFKRLLHWQNEKVSFKDLLVGSLISLVSQNITPKSIGGDIATYWYLRRRNVSRDKLLSAVVINTFVWQISNIVLILIFIPIGIKFYGNFFNNTSGGRNLILLISLILGISIDTILALTLLILSLSSRIQNFALKHLIGFLEWLPFVTITDPENLRTKFQYEFYKVRHGLKTIVKKWYNFLEILLWKLLPWVYVPVALFTMSVDMIKVVPGGAYFNMMTADVLIRNINSISPTPGGTGTSDIIRKIIFEFIIKPDAAGGLSISQKSSLLTSINGVGTVIIPTVLSAIVLILVFIGERRVDIYQSQQKNMQFTQFIDLQTIKRTKTRYYKISFSIMCVLIFVLSIIFIFVKW